jgi:Cu-Zn family superoxide dismutase
MGNTQTPSMNDRNERNERNARNAICMIENKKDGLNIHGYVLFHQCSENSPVKVRFHLYGNPNRIHAIHVHEYGDARDGCKSLGPHFNPYHQTHGSIFFNDTPRHVGDLVNNIKFDENGYFMNEYEDPLISLQPQHISCIVGRPIVIHEEQDDLGRGVGEKRKESLISGNAGNRIRYGVIGVSKTEHF